MSLTAEDRRKAVHVAMTAFVIALRWLTPEQAWACAAAAILLNWVVLPLLGLDLRRPGAPFVDGVKLYPVAVLLVLVLFRMPVAAAAWAVLGVGDAASNVLGRRFGRPPLLGRADRSRAGTAAFVLAACPAAALAYAWVAETPVLHLGALVAAAAAAVAGAAAEFVPLPRWLDDNVPIALAAGTAFHFALG